MPISLSQLTANRKPCTVVFDGVGDLHVEYYPQKLTAKMLTNFAVSDADSLKAMPAEKAVEVACSPIKILTELLASWDLTAVDDGPVMPIDAATLEDLGLPIQWAILSAIMSDGNSQGKAQAPTASRSKRR